MKKALSLLLILLLLTSLLSGIALADAIAFDVYEVSYDVYVTTPDGGLNLRTGPGTEYMLLLTIPDYVKLHISMASYNGWGYTCYNDNWGWVFLGQTTDAAEFEAAQKTPEPTPAPTPVPTPVPTPEPEVVTPTCAEDPVQTPVPIETPAPTATATAAPAEAPAGNSTLLLLVVILAAIAIIASALAIYVILKYNRSRKG